MRNLYELDSYRLVTPEIIERFGWSGDDTCGYFSVPSKIDRAPLRVIASCALGWDHISVSRKNRCPNWPEMDQIKRLFFKPFEVVVQFHVAESEHINLHPYCLHLWRSWDQQYELPDPIMVGPNP